MSTAKTTRQKDTQLTKQKGQFNDLRELLERGKGQLKLAMAKHLDPDRMIRLALTAATRDPKLYDCSQESIGLALLTASQLGIEPNGRDGHLIPYKQTCQFIVDFKGLIKLAYRNPRVMSFSAAAVCENDEFDFVYGTDSFLRHRPALSGRGGLLCAYAICKLKDADAQFVVMGKEAIDKRRAIAQTQKIWDAWSHEMWSKTAVHMLSKYVPLGGEFEKAIEHSNQIESGEAINVEFTEFAETDSRPKSDKLADELDEMLDGKKSNKKEEPREVAEPQESLYEMFAADLRAAAAKKDFEELTAVKNRALAETRIPNGLPMEDFKRLTVLLYELKK